MRAHAHVVARVRASVHVHRVSMPTFEHISLLMSKDMPASSPLALHRTARAKRACPRTPATRPMLIRCYIGHNYIGHDYTGRNYVGHNLPLAQC